MTVPEDNGRALLQRLQQPLPAALLYVAASLKIADLLEHGPRHSADLSSQLVTNPDALYRVLRGMVAIGLLIEQADGSFAVAPLGLHLRTGTVDNVRGEVIRLHESAMASHYLLNTVRTGEPSFQRAFGESIFDRFGRDPDVSRSFSGWFAAGV